MKKTLLVVLFSASSFASAGTLTFDDIGNFEEVGLYAGLNFSNFYALDTVEFYPSGYLNNVVSPNNVIFNASGAEASFSSATAFTFNSVYATAAWNDGQSLDVTGWYQGVQIYSKSLLLNTTTTLLATFDWAGIDTVRFLAHGGNNAGFDGSGDHISLDNLTVSAAVVAEPASVALLGLGMLGLAVARRRVDAK